MVVYFNQKVEIMKNQKTSIKKLFLLLTIQSDGQSKKNFHQLALILRRNEAERKKTQRKIKSNLQYFIPIRHARYQRVYQLLNLKNPSISSYTPFFFVFLHLFSFLSAIKNSASTGLGQRQVTLYSFFLYVPA
jgi:hypothetical protein